MENYIILANKMNQARVFIFPIGAPIFARIQRPLFGSTDIANRGIEPNI